MNDETDSNDTPLWLEQTTEFSDANLDKVITYLKKGSFNPSEQDSFYDKTLGLLRKRVIELLKEIANEPLFSRNESSINTEAINRIKLLCAFILSYKEEEGEEDLTKQALISVIGILVHFIHQKENQNLVKFAIDAMLSGCPIKHFFGWDDILDLKPEMLAYKISLEKFEEVGTANKKRYINKGVIEISNGKFIIYPFDNEDKQNSHSQLIKAFSLFEDKIQIITDKDNKLKQGNSLEINDLYIFTTNYVREQQSINHILMRISLEDTVKGIISSKEKGHLTFTSQEPGYKNISGQIQIKSAILGYTDNDFYKHLKEGDIIYAQLVHNEDDNIFSIEEEFKQFILNDDDCRAFSRKGIQLAKVTNVKLGYKKHNYHYTWWCEDGFPAYSESDKLDFSINDFAYVSVSYIGEGEEASKIFVKVDRKAEANETFDTETSKADCLEHFPYKPEVVNEVIQMKKESIKEICNLLMAFQKTVEQPTEQYKVLCAARILSEMTEDFQSSAYIEFFADYLRDLITFTKSVSKADYAKIKELQPAEEIKDFDQIKEMSDIVKTIKQYGNNDYPEILEAIIEENTDPTLHKIAILVQSNNRLEGVIDNATKNVIKREILKLLSINAEVGTDLYNENGTYFGVENDRQEFKTSFIEAPKDSNMDQRMNIFKGICAFLNSKAGGTLYLGVNDNGYPTGIANDLAKIEKIVGSSYKGVDGYIRYILDQAKKYFDKEVLTNLQFDIMCNETVLAINVKPFEYGVVKLNNDVAYTRLHNESVKMDENEIDRLMTERYKLNSDIGHKINTLMSARANRLQVELQNYASSNSNSTSNRLVEPFGFTQDLSDVWCYEPRTHKNKLFAISRISNIIPTSTAWQYGYLHKEGDLDIFNWGGDKKIHITLRLDQTAKNLLIEKYTKAAEVISKDPKEKNFWWLDTDVHQIKAAASFYLGLAEHIEIIEGEELIQYIKEYVTKYLPK